MTAPKGWLVVRGQDWKFALTPLRSKAPEILVRASAVRRALAKVSPPTPDLHPIRTGSGVVGIAGAPAPSKDRPPEVRAMKVIAIGPDTPKGYRLLRGRERQMGPIRDDMIGYDAITNEWVTLYRYAAMGDRLDWCKFPVARPIPARGRKKGGGK